MQFQITEKDISNTIEIMEKKGFFNKANQTKKKYRQIIIFGIIGFIIVGSVFLYIKQPAYILLLVVVLIMYIGYFFSKFSNELKNSLIEKEYIKLLKKELNYSAGNDLFPLSVEEFYNQSDLLNSYEYVDSEEDSISLKTNNFNLYGEEIKTSKRVEDSEGHRTKEITNHAYIIFIKILDHRFPIKNKIKLLPDIQNSIIKFFIAFIVGTISSLIGYYIIQIIIEYKSININENILYFIIFILFISGVFLYFYFSNKNRVKLESKEFEKKFDVYSKDEIEARRLLTPKMMEQLSDFANKSKFRGLALTFEQNKIYIKFDVNTFLEFSLFGKDMKMQIKNFFHQIKLIVDFLNRVNMEYFSESEFLKKRK